MKKITYKNISIHTTTKKKYNISIKIIQKKHTTNNNECQTFRAVKYTYKKQYEIIIQKSSSTKLSTIQK